MTIAPRVLLPAASVSVDAGATHLSADGIGDPILSAPLWLVEKSENRWTLVLQPGYSQGLGPNWTFDFIADVQISGDNNDAYGGGTL